MKKHVHKQGVQSFRKRDTGNWISHGYDLGYEDGEKQGKDWLLRQSTGLSLMSPNCLSWSCLLTTAVPQETGCTKTWNSNCWPQTTSNSPCSCPFTFHCHRLHLHACSHMFPCMWEDTAATYSLHSLRRWSHKQPLTCNTSKSNLPLGFQFSVWICSPLSSHQREAGSPFWACSLHSDCNSHS